MDGPISDVIVIQRSLASRTCDNGNELSTATSDELGNEVRQTSSTQRTG